MKRTFTCHLRLLEKTTTYDVGNLGPGLEKAQICGVVWSINGITTPLPADNNGITTPLPVDNNGITTPLPVDNILYK